MSVKKTPLKGLPDFTTISDERLKGFIDLSQQLMFSYKQCDEEVVSVMKRVWKQLSDEHADRVSASAVKEISREEEAPKPVVRKIKTVKRIKR